MPNSRRPASSPQHPRLDRCLDRCLDPWGWRSIVAARRFPAAKHAVREETPVSVTGHDSLKARRTLEVDGKRYDYFSLDAAAKAAGLGDIARLPVSMKILLENLVRLENGRTVTIDDIKALGQGATGKTAEREIAFRPARVLMQDLTGVPAVVDLAAMRQAMVDL